LQQKRILFEKLKTETKQLDEISVQIIRQEEQLKLVVNEIEAIKQQLESLLKEDISKKKMELEMQQSLLTEIKLMQQKERQLEEYKARSVRLQIELTELKIEIAELDIKLNNIEKSLLELPKVEKMLNQVKMELQNEQQLLRNKEIEFASSEKENTMLKREIEGVQKEILLLEGKQRELQKIQSLRQWIEDFLPELAATLERAVLLRVYNEFNVLFKEWFSLLIEDENMNVRIDDSFAPVIEQNGHEIMFEHLSGGEKTSCALSYRLALNKVVNDLVSTINTKDIIILDEPTDGFSSSQLDKVRDVLDNLGMKQTILVSHEAKIESFVEHVIRIAKQGHHSTIVS